MHKNLIPLSPSPLWRRGLCFGFWCERDCAGYGLLVLVWSMEKGRCSNLKQLLFFICELDFFFGVNRENLIPLSPSPLWRRGLCFGLCYWPPPSTGNLEPRTYFFLCILCEDQWMHGDLAKITIMQYIRCFSWVALLYLMNG